MKILPVFLLFAFLSICSIAQLEPVNDSVEVEAFSNVIETTGTPDADDDANEYSTTTTVSPDADDDATEDSTATTATTTDSNPQEGEAVARATGPLLPSLNYAKLFCIECAQESQHAQQCNTECGKQSRFSEVCCIDCGAYPGPTETECRNSCKNTCEVFLNSCCPACEKSYSGRSYKSFSFWHLNL